MEIPFETLLLALETVRGTAPAAPTHILPMTGMIKPTQDLHRRGRPGSLVANYDAEVIGQGGEWNAEGDADGNYLAVLFNMAIKAVTAPVTPTGATIARLWTFTRDINADTIKSAALWAGDPNVQKFMSDFAMLDELTFSNNAGDRSVAKLSAKGQCGFTTKVANPAVPASIIRNVFPGVKMQLWIDTSGAIGTTPVTGRLISAEHTIRTGVTYKTYAAGPTASLDFNDTGREPVVGMSTTLVFEVPDMTQYNQWEAAEVLKVRVRHNGPLIEAGFYRYAEFDCYGPFSALDWGTYQRSNRTIKLTVDTQYDATLASDFSVKVQNTKATLE